MNFPSVIDIKNSITKIRKIDLKTESSYNEILTILKSELRIIPVFTTTLEAKDNIYFLRSRVHTHTEKEFYTIDDFKYRKDAESIREYSRCNIPGQQVFYCSLDRPTSYAESLAIRKDSLETEFVTISRWKLKKDIIVGIIAHPYKNKRYTEFDNEFGDKIDYRIEHDCKEFEAQIREILYYFTIEFRYLVENHLYYKVTAAISNLLFEGVDAIIYPSVPFMGEGYNVALKKQVIEDNYINLEHAMIEKFIRLNPLKMIPDLGFNKTTDRISYDLNTVEWD